MSRGLGDVYKRQMNTGLVITVIYTVLVLALVARIDRPRRNRQRLTGRGGDFE